MFAYEVKSTEKIADEMCQDFARVVKKHGYSVAERVVVRTVTLDPPLNISSIKEADSNEADDWNPITQCKPSLSKYEQAALATLKNGTITIIVQGKSITAYAYQRDRFIFTIRSQEPKVKDGVFHFLFLRKSFLGYFNVIGHFEGFGLLEGKLPLEAQIQPINGFQPSKEFQDVFAIDSQVYDRIKRLQSAKIKNQYIELDQPIIRGSVVFVRFWAVGIATEDFTKAIRWSNLAGFEMMIRKGRDFYVETTPAEGLGLLVKAVGRLNPLREHLGMGSLILNVTSASELFRKMANRKSVFTIKNGPVPHTTMMITFRE